MRSHANNTTTKFSLAKKQRKKIHLRPRLCLFYMVSLHFFASAEQQSEGARWREGKSLLLGDEWMEKEWVGKIVYKKSATIALWTAVFVLILLSHTFFFFVVGLNEKEQYYLQLYCYNYSCMCIHYFVCRKKWWQRKALLLCASWQTICVACIMCAKSKNNITNKAVTRWTNGWTRANKRTTRECVHPSTIFASHRHHPSSSSSSPSSCRCVYVNHGSLSSSCYLLGLESLFVFIIICQKIVHSPFTSFATIARIKVVHATRSHKHMMWYTEFFSLLYSDIATTCCVLLFYYVPSNFSWLIVEHFHAFFPFIGCVFLFSVTLACITILTRNHGHYGTMQWIELRQNFFFVFSPAFSSVM